MRGAEHGARDMTKDGMGQSKSQRMGQRMRGVRARELGWDKGCGRGWEEGAEE